ncbi:unnamed protein product [marine sediment metagenome]|uniref:Uncharacterized protein n=1 Tax=marine sediment metagenome TaxID=412755 RepID=X1TMN0_9ZZZZ
MADVSALTEAYIPLEALDGGRVMLHVGNGTGNNVTADLPTKLTNIMSAQICPEAYNAGAGAGIEVFYCARTITAGKVAVLRKADDVGFDDFAFLLAGKVY